jgi:hypothetical protein
MKRVRRKKVVTRERDQVETEFRIARVLGMAVD